MSRESVAKIELDKAEARLKNIDLYNEILEKALIKGIPITGSFKSLQEYSDLPKNVRDNFNLNIQLCSKDNLKGYTLWR